jgi:hypothetical protein
MITLRRVLLCALCVLAAATAYAQVQTGSIVGLVTDSWRSWGRDVALSTGIELAL